MTLNPNQSVQGGQMNSMLDDVTSLLVIYESKGDYYPSSTNLHSIHHRPLFAGKVIATAEVIKVGKKIASIKGELFTKEGKLATTLRGEWKFSCIRHNYLLSRKTFIICFKTKSIL